MSFIQTQTIVTALALATTLGASSLAQEKKKEHEYSFATPEGWASEQIKLPPGFAPKMSYRGHEDIRFAPGMFKPESDSFFSYAVLFWLEPNSDLSAKTLKREIEIYYQGLSETVLKGKPVKALPVQLKMKPAKADKTASRQPTRYTGEFSWTEPFKTAKKQLLKFEVDVWKCDESKRSCLFLIVSPQDDDESIWRTLRKIRRDFRCHAKPADNQ